MNSLFDIFYVIAQGLSGTSRGRRLRRRGKQQRTESLEARQLLAAIGTSEQLQSTLSNFPDDDHTLVANIDMTGVAFQSVGTASNPFTGSFVGTGDGFTITGLNNPLFAHTDGATLGNMTLAGVGVISVPAGQSGAIHVGGLVGNAVDTTITDVDVDGFLINSPSSHNGTVFVGGLVGNAVGSTITNVAFTGSVSGSPAGQDGEVYVGGVVGSADSSAINGADVTAFIVSSSDDHEDPVYVGGLAGKTVDTSIDNAETTGVVDVAAYGGSRVGGLVGFAVNRSSGNGAINDTHADVNLTVSNGDGSGVPTTNICPQDEYGGSIPPDDSYGSICGGVLGMAGGLVGYDVGVDIHCSTAEGDVLTSGGVIEWAGGLIGRVEAVHGYHDVRNTVSITESGASGQATASAFAAAGSSAETYNFAAAGGFAGATVSGSEFVDYLGRNSDASLVIDQVFGVGDVSATAQFNSTSAGGFVGIHCQYFAEASMIDSFAWGDADSIDASGTAYGGGFIGRVVVKGTEKLLLTDIYAVGTPFVAGATRWLGGLTAYDEDQLGFGRGIVFLHAHWLEHSAYTAVGNYADPGPPQIFEDTLQQMQTQATFDDPPSNWDFASTWLMPADSFPRLQWEFNKLEEVPGPGPEPALVIENMHQFSLIAVELDRDYVLLDDIDADNFKHVPVGTSANPFTGSLNGNGHSITNLEIHAARLDSNERLIGLFGATQDADLNNLSLTNIDIDVIDFVTQADVFAGALVAKAVDTTISDISSLSGNLDYWGYGGPSSYGGFNGPAFGGAVGATTGGQISAVDSAVDVDINIGNLSWGYGGSAGGLVGYAEATPASDFSLTDSETTGDVTVVSWGWMSGMDVGGAIGRLNANASSGSATAAVERTSTEGAVDNTTTASWGTARSGGLIGYVRTTQSTSGSTTVSIRQTSAVGDVDASSGSSLGTAGGLLGEVYGYRSSFLTEDSFAWGDASAFGAYGGYGGGLVGRSTYFNGGGQGAATYRHVYSRGDASVQAPPGTMVFVGGLIGYSSGNTFVWTYWNTDGTVVQGIGNDPTPGPHVVGLSTQAMQDRNSFHDDWDFVTIWIQDAQGFPILRNL